MNAIIANEGLNVTEEGKDALLELSGGDMRRVLNVMQVNPPKCVQLSTSCAPWGVLESFVVPMW